MKAKERILVVDDDQNLRKTLGDILKVNGYDTTPAASGAEAIAAAEHATYGLALIDLELPDMTGLEVMARIKAISPLTEAIILASHASLDSAIEATGQGAFSCVLKPCQMDDLLLSIRHAVERKQAQEEILRLASFPRLLPTPLIELTLAGEVTYVNPAAERLFPDLGSLGLSHPVLQGLTEMVAALQQARQQGEAVHEVTLGEETYELHISCVQDAGQIRIYVLVVTQRKRAEKDIHLLATIDSLTGIANRREFTRILTMEIERARRYGNALSLAMYDVDSFKRVNDTFGHDIGDYVLQAVAELVTENVRAHDVVARWSGEEFMMLMAQSDLQAARNAAEKLRLVIAGRHFDTAGRLTASFGVTSFEPQDTVSSLLKRVDDALYLAKERGRNRVECLDGKAAK